MLWKLFGLTGYKSEIAKLFRPIYESSPFYQHDMRMRGDTHNIFNPLVTTFFDRTLVQKNYEAGASPQDGAIDLLKQRMNNWNCSRLDILVNSSLFGPPCSLHYAGGKLSITAKSVSGVTMLGSM